MYIAPLSHPYEIHAPTVFVGPEQHGPVSVTNPSPSIASKTGLIQSPHAKVASLSSLIKGLKSVSSGLRSCHDSSEALAGASLGLRGSPAFKSLVKDSAEITNLLSRSARDINSALKLLSSSTKSSKYSVARSSMEDTGILLTTCWGNAAHDQFVLETDDEPWDEDDFYTLLKVSPSSRLSDIKRAYRRLSLEFHPDTTENKTDGTVQLFQKLARAYEVLSDENLRRVYDREGIEGVEEYEKRQASGAGRHQDPFAAMFGFGGQRENAKRPSIRVPLFLSLKDLYLGKKLEASVFKHTRCKKCRGTGAKTKKDIHKCHKCNGQGVVVSVQQIGHGMYQQFHQTCPVCNGKGKVIKRQCDHCKGKKIVPGVEEVLIHIEKGMKNGEEISFSNMCDEVAESSDAPGDILFRVNTIESKDLQRDGNNLKLNVVISLKESLLGFKKEFEHLDGHIVPFARNDMVTPHGFVQKIPHEGMPRHGDALEFGDLLITYSVKFPDHLTKEQIAAIESL